MALINARSLVNNIFLLNDFFTTHSLDFMFITESWTKVGDLTPFSELVPDDCTFPLPEQERGWFSDYCKGLFFSFFFFLDRCLSVSVDTFACLEVQLLHLDWNGPILLAAFYRPPHSATDFIQQFTEFIVNIAIKYDRFSLVGDWK